MRSSFRQDLLRGPRTSPNRPRARQRLPARRAPPRRHRRRAGDRRRRARGAAGAAGADGSGGRTTMKLPGSPGFEDKAFLALVIAVSLAFALILWPFFGAVFWAA